MEPTSRDNGEVHVLLVEDEFLIAQWVAECLEEEGFVVHTASDAGEALRQLNARNIDVLLTDINLPGGMDGLALARRARQILPDLPVIYASALVAALATHSQVPGAIFLHKPYHPETVGRLIARATRRTKEPALA
jgi:CheY-like chemotaxis protein